jgi:hypothetical protein
MTGVLVAVLSAAPVPPVHIVIPDARLVGTVDAATGTIVAEEVARALPAAAFQVTTSSQLSTVLGLERQRQLLGCSAEQTGSCMAELASALGAEVLAQITLSRVGDRFRCDVAFVSGRDGATIERVTAEANSAAELFEAMRAELAPAVARMFSQQRRGDLLVPMRPGVRRHAWLPAVVGAAFAVGGATFFALTLAQWNRLKTESLLVSQARSLAATGQTEQTVAWVLSGIGAAALVTAALIFALGAPTEATVVVSPVSADGAVSLLLSGGIP